MRQIRIVFLLVILFSVGIVWMWLKANNASKRDIETAFNRTADEELRYKYALEQLVSKNKLATRQLGFQLNFP